MANDSANVAACGLRVKAVREYVSLIVGSVPKVNVNVSPVLMSFENKKDALDEIRTIT